MPDASYVRPAGRIVLYPHTAIPWYGVGSKIGVELFDIVTKSGYLGTFSYGATDGQTGLPTTDLLWSPDRYLAMRPKITARDTPLSEWEQDNLVTDQGTWGESRPYRSPSKLYVQQVDTTPNKSFSRRSTFQHAKDASFAFRIQLGEAPPDTDRTSASPYAAVGWGGAWDGKPTWAIFFIDGRNPLIAQRVKGVWVARRELPTPPRAPGRDRPGDLLVVVEKKRQSLFVALSYAEDSPPPPEPVIPVAIFQTERDLTEKDKAEAHYSPPGGVTWESGRFHLFGYGLAVAFNMPDLSLSASGTWDSTKAPLQQPRSDTPEYVVWGNENGGQITLSMLSDGSDFFCQYRLTLQPWSQTLGSRTWYRTPDVEAVEFWYPAITVPGFLSVGDLGAGLEGRVLDWRVEKPERLDQATLFAKLYFPDGFRLTTGAWRMRPASAQLGVDLGGALALDQAFFGFVTAMRARQLPNGVVEADMTATAGTVRLKRSRFRRSTAPRGGRTLNQVLDRWLLQEGIPLTGRAWHPLGDLVTLPRGVAEDPALKPPPDGDAWEWHARLCDYHGLELVWTDNGTLATFPKHEYVLSAASWEAAPADVDDRIEELEAEEDVLGSYTRLVVVCRGENGAQVMRWGWNPRAEQDPGYTAGFRSWTEEHLEAVDLGPLSEGFANLALVNLADDFLLPRTYVNLVGEYAPLVGRRSLVRVTGDRMEAGGWYVIRALSHEAKEGDFVARTRALAWRHTPLL